MVPLFNSSTEWWILPVRNRDKYAHCRTVFCWTGYWHAHCCACPGTVTAQRPYCLVPCSSRQLRFTSCSPLTTCSMCLLCKSSSFLDASCEETVEIPQLQPLKLDFIVHGPLLCNDNRRTVQTPENCASSEVAVRLNVVDAPVMQGLRSAANAVPAVIDVPVIMQKRWFATMQFLRFSSLPDLVDIPVRNRSRTASWVR